MDPALERRIQVLMLGLDESMRLARSELSHLIADESEGRLKLHNQLQSHLNTAVINDFESAVSSDSSNGFDSLKPHVLDKDSISTLYEYHRPPGFTLKQFDQFVRSLPLDDVQDLFDAMPKEEERFGGVKFSLNRLVQKNASRKALRDKLWSEYGPSFGLDKAMENDSFEAPVRKQAGMSSKSFAQLRTSISQLPVSELARGSPERALQSMSIPPLAKSPSSLQPHPGMGDVDMTRKRRRSNSLGGGTRNSNQLKDAAGPLPKSSSISNTASSHDTPVNDYLQEQPSQKKRRRTKKKSSQRVGPPIPAVNLPVPVVPTTQGDHEATSKAIRRRKKQERRRKKRRRHDKEQVKTASGIDVQGNVKTGDAFKSVQSLDGRMAEQPISSCVPARAHLARCLSPELGDVLIAERTTPMKSFVVDDHDSAYEESTSFDDLNGGSLRSIGQIQTPEKIAISNQHSSRMSTPPLLTFDQETGEMLCIPESPFRPSAVGASDSETSNENSDNNYKLRSPLKVLVNRVNKVLEPGAQDFEESDVNGSEVKEPEHMEVDLDESVYEKPELDKAGLGKAGLPKVHSTVQLMDVVAAESLLQEEPNLGGGLTEHLKTPEHEVQKDQTDSEGFEIGYLDSGLSAWRSRRPDPMIEPHPEDPGVSTYNVLKTMVLNEDASVSALESDSVTYADEQPSHTFLTDDSQTNVRKIGRRSNERDVSIPGDGTIKSPPSECSKSDIAGPDQSDSRLALYSQHGSSASSKDHKKVEIRCRARPSKVPLETEKKTQNSPNRRTGRQSQYFQSPTASPDKPKRLPAGTSCMPFPPLSAESFGLIQEKVAHDPFKLLVAVTLLNKTKGTVAIPVFHTIIERYPTAADLAHANISDLAAVIQNLGLQNSRTNTLVNLAKTWIKEPPVKGKRYRTLNYPVPGAGRSIRPSEVLDDDDERQGAFEIGHLPGCGSYARDSWRIFQPEWTRVVPKDKELRAFLRWSWLREGFAWDPLTGEKEVAAAELRDQAEHGHMSWDDPGSDNAKTGSPAQTATHSRTDHVGGSPQIDATVGASLDTKRSSEASARGSLESDSDSSRRGVIATKTPAAPIERHDPGILSHPVEEDGPITKLLRLSERRKPRTKKRKGPGKRRSKRLSSTDGMESIGV